MISPRHLHTPGKVRQTCDIRVVHDIIIIKLIWGGLHLNENSWREWVFHVFS